jgi:hypothetical protein
MKREREKTKAVCGGSRRGKTLAEMKKMARDREVWRSWRKTPDAVMAQTGTGKKKKKKKKTGLREDICGIPIVTN